MKHSAIRHCLQAMLVGLIAMSGSRATAGETMSSAAVNISAAQYSGTHVLYEIYVPVGLAPGHSLRYTWTNHNDPDPEKREFEPLRIRVKLLAADGSVIAQTEAAAVGAGQFQYLDFDRDRISLPGEAGTGRLQARLEITVTGQTLRSVTDLEQVILKTFASSVEVIDNSSGRTTSYVNTKNFQIISAGTDGRF